MMYEEKIILVSNNTSMDKRVGILSIPYDLIEKIGEPSKVIIELIGRRYIRIRPVKPIEVNNITDSIEAEQVIEAFNPYSNDETNIVTHKSSCVNVNEHIKENICIHEFVERILVKCEKNEAIVEYLDGYVERILDAYSCGYDGSSPRKLVDFISWLSGRAVDDIQVNKAEKAITSNKTKFVEVYNDIKKIEVNIIEEIR